MIKKTIMITSIAVLIAVTSIATTMTMVQASPIGDDIDIIIDGVLAEPQSFSATPTRPPDHSAARSLGVEPRGLGQARNGL